MTLASGTPAAQGYRMPAEWEPHTATWLAWPHERTDWPGPGKLEAVRWVYAEVVRHLVTGERVRILVRDERLERQARGVLRRAGVDLDRVAGLGTAPDGSGPATPARSSCAVPTARRVSSAGASTDGRSPPPTAATRPCRASSRGACAIPSGCRSPASTARIASCWRG